MCVVVTVVVVGKVGFAVKKFRKKARELPWAEFSSSVFLIPSFAPLIISEKENLNAQIRRNNKAV